MSKITETSRDKIADEKFAFPKERKEPIHDAAHVRNAIARFNQVQGVTDSERDAAWKRIKSAAGKYKVDSYPTILFVKEDGTEIGRMVGYCGPDEFIKTAGDLLAGHGK